MNRRGIFSVITVLVGGLAISGSQVKIMPADAQASMDMAVREWRGQQADARSGQAALDAGHDRDGVGHARGGRGRLARLANVSVTPSSSPDLLVARLDAAGSTRCWPIPTCATSRATRRSRASAAELDLKQTLIPLAPEGRNPLDLTASLTATKPSHLLTTLGLANKCSAPVAAQSPYRRRRRRRGDRLGPRSELHVARQRRLLRRDGRQRSAASASAPTATGTARTSAACSAATASARAAAIAASRRARRWSC